MGSAKTSFLVLTSIAAAMIGLASPATSIAPAWSTELVSRPWQMASFSLGELRAEASHFVVNIDGP